MNFPMKWAAMPFEMRECILNIACLNSNLAHYEWEELAAWREYIEPAINQIKIVLDEE